MIGHANYTEPQTSESSHVVPELTTVHDAIPRTAPVTVLSHDQNIHQSHVIDRQAVLQKMTINRTPVVTFADRDDATPFNYNLSELSTIPERCTPADNVSQNSYHHYKPTAVGVNLIGHTTSKATVGIAAKSFSSR